MATKHQKFNLNLEKYSPLEREAIAIEVIDRIVKRTRSEGVDKNGKPFPKYSSAYKNSQAFKIGGKSSKVDLTLSGDMLDSIKVLSNRGGKVTIGFESGSTENGKADGNIRGTYGQSSPIGPRRDFLGISGDELERILKKYPAKTNKAEDRAIQKLKSVEIADRLSGAVDIDDLEDE